jgi:hypothetical protein
MTWTEVGSTVWKDLHSFQRLHFLRFKREISFLKKQEEERREVPIILVDIPPI